MKRTTIILAILGIAIAAYALYAIFGKNSSLSGGGGGGGIIENIKKIPVVMGITQPIVVASPTSVIATTAASNPATLSPQQFANYYPNMTTTVGGVTHKVNTEGMWIT
jgi:hypothetical protein